MDDDPSQSPREAISEYTRRDLEQDFKMNCEALDSKAKQIIKLEQKLNYLQSRVSRIAYDLNDRKNPVQTMRPTQTPASELDIQITVLERTLAERKQYLEQVTKQVQYFKGIQSKGSSASTTPDEVKKMISDLLRRNVLAGNQEMYQRLGTALYILERKYTNADAGLKSVLREIGEDTTLSESVERRREVREREKQIAELTEKRKRLKALYKEMEKKQRAKFEEFQAENDKYRKKTEKIEQLQREKETRMLEATKAAEMEMAIESLQKDIATLRKQKTELKQQLNKKDSGVVTEAQQQLRQLKVEVREIEEKIEKMAQENVELEKTLKKTHAGNGDVVADRRDAEKVFKSVQAEYKEVMERSSKIMAKTDRDPFEDKKFLSLLEEMTEKQVIPDKFGDVQENIAKIDAKINELREAMQQKEREQSEIAERVSAKRQQMLDLDAQLRAISEKLGDGDAEPKRERVNYIMGAAHIDVEKAVADANVTVGEDQNAIVILFRDFKMAPAFVGQKESQVFVVLHFLENQSLETGRVDPKAGEFNSTLVFTCKNDIILKAYLEKSALPLQMCREREAGITEIGQSELNLAPVATDGVQAFTAIVSVWNQSGKVVSKITYEIALLKPIVQ